MSVRASNWVMHQVRTDGPSAQGVLFVIADMADPDGIARHTNPEDIATRSRQSRATVFRRLRELEHFGLLTWLAQGKQQYEFHLTLGREFDYDRKMVEAMRGTRDEDLGEGSPDEGPQTVESQSETPHNAAVESQSETISNLKESHSCDSIKNPLVSKKDSPQKPPERSGGLSSEPAERAESEADPPGLAEFTAAYPIPSNKPAQVRALWFALDAEGRARNIRGAIGARRYRETTKPKPSLPAPEQFIRNGAAEAYLAHAPDASPQAPQGPQWVLIDSPEGRALSVLHRIARAPQPLSHARPSGEFFLLKIPLDERALAFADAPDPRQWITITETAKIAAWGEFLQAAIGRAPATSNGLSVPWPWPPKKDGTTYDSQAPPGQIPGTLMTESDAQELDKTGS